ncbi:uncharacterized protein B0T15DRAFT_389760 [Chaetomium strumarium]|uniref:Glycoside hydrolase family 76 protein n=1 Tax=Chaetomium strumarium TaxID=1170767 RepID=A0AAJ0M573_9PEZI|nr:hypothetical protein B0T15DRAFT_389760 [Chaetomium strumarium]
MLGSWFVAIASATGVSAASAWSALPLRLGDEHRSHAGSLPAFQIFHEMIKALDDMQDTYFQRWIGTWPEGIDWTRAVMSTHVAATLRTISDELKIPLPHEAAECALRKDDVISGYFADIIAYYFAEDAFAIRNEAYDDMLWVVLGWLESIRFVDERRTILSRKASRGLAGIPTAEAWYGSRWVPAFAHRARIFWELAAKGWDTELCGGGMIWNPRLMPYKNAITNQLFISASIGMYLNFPGDPNTSPFFGTSPDSGPHNSHRNAAWQPHDPVFARAAQEAHKWLASSNMSNPQGLYIDGFHISTNTTRCDSRDEMVYTYNQGVILSGLLGLFQATGLEHYLQEGHTLIGNVIRATGYSLARNAPVDDIRHFRGGQLPPWRGLGRAGVLEDACDVFGSCSQDAQTFKGIWMHHFATFCSPAALRFLHAPEGEGEGEGGGGLDGATTAEGIRARHAGKCRRYLPWLRHNARAAMGTRDGRGLFGMWWTAGLLRGLSSENMELAGDALPQSSEGEEGVVDYRNLGVPRDAVWMRNPIDLHPPVGEEPLSLPLPLPGQKPLSSSGGRHGSSRGSKSRAVREERGPSPGVEAGASTSDPNLRGRGRTVETQGGGLAVLRALWVVSRHEL